MQHERLQVDHEIIRQAFSTLSNELPRFLNSNTVRTVEVLNSLETNFKDLHAQQTTVLDERFDKIENGLKLLNARLDRFEELLLRLPGPAPFESVVDIRERSANAIIIPGLGDGPTLSREEVILTQQDITALHRYTDSHNTYSSMDQAHIFPNGKPSSLPDVCGVTVDLVPPSISDPQDLTVTGQVSTRIPLSTDSNGNVDSGINEADIEFAPISNRNSIDQLETYGVDSNPMDLGPGIPTVENGRTSVDHRIKHYNVGDIVLANIRGYSQWPGQLVDPENVPETVVQERPSKKNKFYCVRFFSDNHYAWVLYKDLSLLHKQEVEAFINEPLKRPVELLKAYCKASLAIQGVLSIDEKNKEDTPKRGKKRESEGNIIGRVLWSQAKHAQADSSKESVRITKRLRIETPPRIKLGVSTVNKNQAIGRKKYEFGDIILAKVRGHSLAWPGRIVDPEDVPLSEAAALRDPPSNDKLYCVRLFSSDKYMWKSTTNILLLQKHELEAYINKPDNKSIELLKAYKIAMESMDPFSWEASSGVPSSYGISGEVDELDEIEEDSQSSPARAGRKSNRKFVESSEYEDESEGESDSDN